MEDELHFYTSCHKEAWPTANQHKMLMHFAYAGSYDTIAGLTKLGGDHLCPKSIGILGLKN